MVEAAHLELRASKENPFKIFLSRGGKRLADQSARLLLACGVAVSLVSTACANITPIEQFLQKHPECRAADIDTELKRLIAWKSSGLDTLTDRANEDLRESATKISYGLADRRHRIRALRIEYQALSMAEAGLGKKMAKTEEARQELLFLSECHSAKAATLAILTKESNIGANWLMVAGPGYKW